VTLFERAALRVQLRSIRALTLEDSVLVEVADFFGLRAMT
jgi:hypothetical protein